MFNLMGGGKPENEHKQTDVQKYAVSNDTRKKGLENMVTIGQKEVAKKILGQLDQAREVLEKDRRDNYNTDGYDVFDNAETVLNDFYIDEAHMSADEAKTVASKMAELYKIFENVDEMIDDKVYESTMANVQPNREEIFSEVIKVVRLELEKIKLSPAKIEVLLDNLCEKKMEWIREPKPKLQQKPQQQNWTEIH